MQSPDNSSTAGATAEESQAAAAHSTTKPLHASPFNLSPLPSPLTHCSLEVGAEQQLLQVLVQPSQPSLFLRRAGQRGGGVSTEPGKHLSRRSPVSRPPTFRLSQEKATGCGISSIPPYWLPTSWCKCAHLYKRSCCSNGFNAPPCTGSRCPDRRPGTQC